MAVEVVVVDVVVVVLPVPRARVIRGIDVNRVDFALMGVEKDLERVEVLGVDHCVKRPVAAALHLACRHQSRVDRIAELGDYNQIVHGPPRGLMLGLRVFPPDQVGYGTLVGSANPADPPKPVGRRCSASHRAPAETGPCPPCAPAGAGVLPSQGYDARS